jgi:putative ABC transport system ATP-binding protein
MMAKVIELQDITKVYAAGNLAVQALRGISFTVEEGEYVSLMGASGSGKSTLLNLLGCLDRPTSGRYLLGDRPVEQLSDRELALIRNQEIGFVFQSFNLLPRLNAIQNVEIPLIYAGAPAPERRQKAEAALDMVGLGDRKHHHPFEMSGGQQQRVAIARCLVNKPKLILADEPTGNLDSATSQEIMRIFTELNEEGITIVLVTHEPDIAAYTKRIIRFRDGLILSDRAVTSPEEVGAE